MLLANYFESDAMNLFKKKWLEWFEDKENQEQGYKRAKSTSFKQPPSIKETQKNPTAWQQFLQEYVHEV